MSEKNTDQTFFKTKNGQSFDIPIAGSLGLLAFGDIGLMLWREKKLKVKAMNQQKKSQ